MKRISKQPLVWGATLFTAPGVRNSGHIPAWMDAVIVLIVLTTILVPVVLGLRSAKRNPPDPGPGDGWDKRPKPPRNPPRGPRGGIPLEDSVPARVRLRGHERLTDGLPARTRRPAREPERRPARETTPH